MNWDDIRIFTAVARTRRMDLAARKLGIDASTVGRRVARLQASLGVTLFEQSRLDQVLTEIGRRLFDYAEDMERAALAATGKLTGKAGELSGFVRVSVSEGFGTWILARHLRAFHDCHPAITVDVVSSGGFLSPSRHEADVAIMLARPPRGPLIVRRLADYGLGLYAAKSYLGRHGIPHTVENLREHTLIGYIPELIQVPQQRLIEEISAGLTPKIRSTSINAQAAMVSSGAGIGVLPCFIGEQLPRASAVLPSIVRLERCFWLVVHKDVRHFARVDAFVTWIDEVFQQDRRLIVGPR